MKVIKRVMCWEIIELSGSEMRGISDRIANKGFAIKGSHSE